MKLHKVIRAWARPFFSSIALVAVVSGIYVAWRVGCFDFSTARLCADGMRQMVEQNYLSAVALYMAAFIGALAISIPVSAIFSTIGGFLFGWGPAVVLATGAVTIGSIIAFMMVRLLFGAVLQKRYNVQLARFNAAIEQDGARYLLASRLSLLFPFFLINILAGLTKVPLATFIWTTVVGAIPSVAVYALAGQQIYRINSPADLLSPGVLAAFLLLVLFVLAPIIWRHLRGR